MGTRNFLQTPVTGDNMALNAGMYHFAAHSLLTPHAAIKKKFWTDSMLNKTVSRKFVVQKVSASEREMLDYPIGQMDDMTDDTYLEWILKRARRLFFILNEIGCADRIFALVDDSWQDEDLPVSRADLGRLGLSRGDSGHALEMRFYYIQFYLLLRIPLQNDHIAYGPNEHIPLDYALVISPAVSIADWHRVFIADDPGKIFMRRQYDLLDDRGSTSRHAEFLEDIRLAKVLRHEHIAQIWASYTDDQGKGFTLHDFVGEHTLKTFMRHRLPLQYAALAEDERYCLLLEWMHCLTDAVAYLHSQGVYHGAIRPSNILIDAGNGIAFSDVGYLKTFKRGKRHDKHEIREYTAPELQPSRGKAPESLSISSPVMTHEILSSLHFPTRSLSSPLGWANGALLSHVGSPDSFLLPPSPPMVHNFSRPRHGSTRSDCGQESDSRTSSPPKSPMGPHTPPMTPSPPLDQSPRIPAASTCLYRSASPSATKHPLSPLSTAFTIGEPLSCVNTCDMPSHSRQSTDIFSLGCIFLDMLTFLVHGKLTRLDRFRATRRIPVGVKFATTGSDSVSVVTPVRPATKKKLTVPEETLACNTTKLEAWMTTLRVDAEKRTPIVAPAIVELLRLVRVMLVQSPAMRPTAAEVKGSIETILERDCSIEGLCCGGRERDWHRHGEADVSQGLADAIWESGRARKISAGEEKRSGGAVRKAEGVASARRDASKPGDPSAYGSPRQYQETLDEGAQGLGSAACTQTPDEVCGRTPRSMLGRLHGRKTSRDWQADQVESMSRFSADTVSEKGLKILGLGLLRKPWKGPEVKAS